MHSGLKSKSVKPITHRATIWFRQTGLILYFLVLSGRRYALNMSNFKRRRHSRELKRTGDNRSSILRRPSQFKSISKSDRTPHSISQASVHREVVSGRRSSNLVE